MRCDKFSAAWAGSHVALFLLTAVGQATADVTLTVYYAPGQTPLADGTVPDASATPTAYDDSLQAYSTATLVAPAAPNATAMPTAFALAVPSAVPAGASIEQSGSFFGFSVEMSVVNQVLGKNSSLLQVPFLNLMANLQQRTGRIHVRVGGNTQETATLVESTSDGKILEKDLTAVSGTTDTPPLIFTADLIQMMRNISDLVNVHWFLGVPFNDTNWRLEIVETGQAILGEFLIGIQAGNEPDLYANHGRRPTNYTQDDYFGEFGLLIQALDADTSVQASKLLIAPSVSTNWSPESVLSAGTGFIPTYGSSLEALAVEHYPSDNCGVAFPDSGIAINDPQSLLSTYLSHGSATSIVSPYLNTSEVAQTNGLPFYMFETNTASCGGFAGLSDAFASALWGVDYAMQMAAVNFSTALFHVGGQSVSYNPFTPPPTNESTFHQWTIGPIYYSALVVAEALGASNTSQVLDLNANSGNELTPAYGIWEHGALTRVLLINFANDPTGASTLQVDLSMPDGTLPSTVNVKLLLANNVTQKGNFTWAGQTFGGNFQSDGRPIGAEDIATTACGVPTDGSSTTAACRINVPAPGAALVFMSGTAAADEIAGAPSVTFSTTSVTKVVVATATVPASLLATSNGHGGNGTYQMIQLGSTSKGSVTSAGASIRALPAWAILGSAVAAALGILSTNVW
ncbi:glycoside hydrolase family 79 protein [Hypholoma sublateritium FD-334 SS-4]|uniref:Glycoside hydrolase family 79 protein n=1 Tax=Hypholoma sublateritium (strain FD-334 SS-4) TaxID=945553 RepID=A0A0D2P7E1_HYPSF|nr:glycoside hydrolase family 79 protein [Hypholoma sublateritium FD-334 SS-4]